MFGVVSHFQCVLSDSLDRLVFFALILMFQNAGVDVDSDYLAVVAVAVAVADAAVADVETALWDQD